MNTHMHHSFESGMFVRRWGPTNGQPLLWIHGLGESGLCMEAIVRHPGLAGIRHIIPDMPGYGRSPHPARPPALDDIVEHLAAWLDTRKDAPVTLAGHSLGGVLAILLARRHPRLIRALVDIDGNKSPGDCGYSGQAMGATPETFVATVFPAMLDTIYRNGLEDPASRGYYASLRQCDPAVFYRHSRELVALSETGTLARQLADLPIPVFYIAGSPGGASPESLELLRQAGVSTTVISPSGHWPFIDQPDSFAAALRHIMAASVH